MDSHDDSFDLALLPQRPIAKEHPDAAQQIGARGAAAPVSVEITDAFKLLYGFAGFQALHACIELGVLEELVARGSATFAELRDATLASPQHLRSLLCVACSFGLLERRGGRYANSALAATYFTRGMSRNLLPFVASAQRLQYKGFFHTSEALRAGRASGLREYGAESTLYELMSSDEALEDTLYEVMARIWDLCSDGLRDVPELRSARRMVDVCGGSGHVANLLTDFYPELHVTVFDRATACARVREMAAGSAKQSRIDAVPGDALMDPLPEADAIMFAHCLEWLSPDRIVALLKRAYDALPSGGHALCYQFAVNDDETGGVYSARLSLYFNVVETGQGYAYPAVELASFFEAAGFVEVRSTEGSFEHVLVTGKKV
jgi:ubiquinone/menaquinone biosynthesis C-methylase UbiE